MTRKTKLVLIIVGANAAVLALVLFVLVPMLLRHLQDDVKDRIAKVYKADDIVLEDTLANSYGLESAGAGQVRGNGGLVLTRTTLHFFQMVPSREVKIPLERLVETSVVKSHLGKTSGYDLLKVQFKTERGEDNSIAFFVKQGPEAWRTKIREVAGK